MRCSERFALLQMQEMMKEYCQGLISRFVSFIIGQDIHRMTSEPGFLPLLLYEKCDLFYEDRIDITAFPHLASPLLSCNINLLQGYLLGNPASSPAERNYNVLFAHGMGLISDELYEVWFIH